MAEEPPEQESASKAPNWVDKATLWVGVAGFLTTTVVSVVSLGLDRDLKTIETKLNATNAKVAEFQALGTLDYSYNVVDLRNFCSSTQSIESFEPSFSDTVNLYDSFVQNEAWKDAEENLDATCATTMEQIHPQNPKEYYLAYLEITPGSNQSFNPRIAIDLRTVPAQPGKPIWSYEKTLGSLETIPPTLLRKGANVRVPVALLSGQQSASRIVFVPVEARWETPITGASVRLPLTFIVDQRHWRSIRDGHRLSRA